MTTTIPRLLREALARDGAQPFVTFYDEHTGERIELSVVTAANWVAKTANMLQDSLDAESGSHVHLDLPLHWETVVWLLACWSVGCEVDTEAGEADVAVLGPDLDVPAITGHDHVVALSLRPLGGRFADALPAGVIDYNAEVLGHGDHFSAFDEPTPDTVAVRTPGGAVDHAGVVDAAVRTAELAGLGPGARLLVTSRGVLADALAAALVVGGSLVLVTDSSSATVADDRLRALADAERVTARLD